MSINSALNITRTGLTLQEAVIGVIAQNLSGAGADSFQKLTVVAKDLPYVNQAPGAPTSSSGTINEVGLQMGTGVKIVGIQRSMQQTDYKQTDDPLDLAIEGKGYYQIQLPNGDIAYTRVASFRVDPQSNNLSTTEGYPLLPNITVPPDAQDLMIGPDGTVEVSVKGTTNSYKNLGQISLTTFVNPSGLKAVGDTMFLETPASGSPSTETPGSNNKGYLKQGYRENSNVNPVEEIIQLVVSQQQYEALTKVISTADEMARAANQRIA